MQRLLAQSISDIDSPVFSEPDSAAPASYGDTLSEYEAARTKAAVRDASHWNRLIFEGEDHPGFLHRMTTNHLLGLTPSHGLETVFPDNRGRIVDVGSCSRLEDESTLVVSSPPGGPHALAEWLDRYLFAESVRIRDLTEETAMIELLGPDASSMALALHIDLATVDEHGQVLCEGNHELIIVRLDRFSWPGLRAIGKVSHVADLWHRLRRQGAHPLGEDAFEQLRIESGLPMPHTELNLDYNPWESGLTQAIHMDKGCYIGQEVIARLDTYDKVKQHLVGLKLDGVLLPTGNAAVHVDGREVGRVTSATRSPRLSSNIALAYVRNSYCVAGTRATIEAANHHGEGVDNSTEGVDNSTEGVGIGAEVVDLPFVLPS